MDRRSLFDIVPLGTWFGLAITGGMAVTGPARPYAVIAVLLTVAWTVFAMWRRIVEIEAEARPSLPAKGAEAEGPSSELGIQDILGALPDPVMVIAGHEPDDIAGRWIVFANAAARQMFQLRDGGGLLVSAVRNPEVLECVDEALFGGINGTTIFETSGGARDQYWRAFSAPLPSGGVNRLALLVLRDETDARRMERMRADFLANASHELRTPLASLSGFIETLRGPAKDDAAARDKFLNIMAAQADRMGRLIYDLLSLSRIEMNEHVPPSGEADLALVVRDVVDGLSLMAQNKGVALSIDGPPPGLYRIIGERDQLLQVVQNLVDNALKYAPRDTQIAIEIAFDLTLEQAIAGRDPSASKLVLLRPDRNVHDYYARVRVRDAGPGIGREHLPRLAERFYRVEGQKSGDRLGTGLGLAIVKHIVNRHRGGLVVESRASGAGADSDLALMDGKVAALPVAGPETFTAFSAYFPQRAAYGVGTETPRLATRDGERLKDAG